MSTHLILLDKDENYFIMKKCIICLNEANAKNSHIVPLNVIKDCIGKRYNELSYNINLSSSGLGQSLYIGDQLKHKAEEINVNNLKTVALNPYTLDNILCTVCESKLGKIEGLIYSEIVLKIRNEKYKNNFRSEQVNKFDVLIPDKKKITKSEIDVYFYSIILRMIHYLKFKHCQAIVNEEITERISKFLKERMFGVSDQTFGLETGIIVYVTNKQDLHPALMETNSFEKLIIPMCNFIVVLECSGKETLFGNAMNYIKDSDFRFIKNSEEMESVFSVFNNINNLFPR